MSTALGRLSAISLLSISAKRSPQKVSWQTAVANDAFAASAEDPVGDLRFDTSKTASARPSRVFADGIVHGTCGVPPPDDKKGKRTVTTGQVLVSSTPTTSTLTRAHPLTLSSPRSNIARNASVLFSGTLRHFLLALSCAYVLAVHRDPGPRVKPAVCGLVSAIILRAISASFTPTPRVVSVIAPELVNSHSFACDAVPLPIHNRGATFPTSRCSTGQVRPIAYGPDANLQTRSIREKELHIYDVQLASRVASMPGLGAASEHTQPS
ncbi:hypothetical protein VTO73DRAFT_11601 [Trametes versicolor]